jgi:hypothetical protein
MRDEPAWWAQARRLRADGLTLKALGTHVGKTEAAVSVAVSDRLRKLQTHAQPVLRGNSSGDAAFVAAHTPHIARKLLDEAAIPAAARAFVSGQIDRAELMRRITPA